MMLDNPSAFSAFKNIASLLPSVQNKMTHNALIKLLLDQGRTFNKTQDVVFETTLADMEKMLRQKQIPFETLYRTDKHLTAETDTWAFSVAQKNTIYLSVEHALSAYLLGALLGQPIPNADPLPPLSEMEKQILSAFYQRWVRLLPQTRAQSVIFQAFNPPEIPTNTPAFSFVFKTNTHAFGFQITCAHPDAAEDQTIWRERLKAHVRALEIPLTGTVAQNIPLSHFLSLKKGDTLSFAAPADCTVVCLQTHQHPVLKGRLKKGTPNNALQVETEEA